MKYESIINEIFNGTECMAAHIMPSGEEYSVAADEMQIAEKKLSETFSKVQEELFEEYESARCDVSSFEDTETFRCGVSVGVRFLLEALSLEKI